MDCKPKTISSKTKVLCNWRQLQSRVSILFGFKQPQVVVWWSVNFNILIIATPIPQQIAGVRVDQFAGVLTWMETCELMRHTTPTLYWIKGEKMLLEKILFLISDQNHPDKMHSCRYFASQRIHLWKYVFVCSYFLCEHLLCVGGCAFEHG